MSGTEWKDRNVLITGITGFKGTALAIKLKELGANVVGLVREVNRLAVPIQDCKLIQGDICNYDTLREAISFHEIDTIFHFAAFAIVRVAAKDPVSTYRVNVMGTVNVLEAARSVGGVKQIIVASSDKAYGDHSLLPYTETFALTPKNTYDTSKACMDMIARSYANNYKMPIVVTRCSNIYGPGDMNLSRIIPNTIRRVLAGKPPMVYTDVKSMEREFIYIDDVVDAYLKLGNAADQFKGQAYNIGGTGAVKIYDLLEEITAIMSYEGEVEVRSRPAVFKEIQKQYIDATKLEKMTGWKPDVPLKSGLEYSVRWYTWFFETGEWL